MKDPARTNQELLEEIAALRKEIEELKGPRAASRTADSGIAEEAFGEGARFVDSLLDAIPLPLFYKDRSGRYLGVNRSFEEGYGQTRQELIGKTIFDIVPKELAEATQLKDRELLGQSAPQVYQTQIKDADGVVHDVVFHKAVFTDGRGRVAGLVGAILDITEQERIHEELRNHREHLKKLVEERTAELQRVNHDLEARIAERDLAVEGLRKSEEKFRKAFYTSPDAVNINRCDDGMYVSINKGFTEILGYSEEEAIGKSSLYLSVWCDEKDRARLVEGLTRHGKVENLEAQFRARNGGLVWGMMSASMIDLDGVPHIISVTRDVTQRKQAEEEKERLESQLFHSQKLEAIGTLTGGIAHDFNNILTALSGYATLVRMKMDREDPLLPYVMEILSGSEKAADLIKKLLVFSRQQPVSLSPVNVNSIIRGTEKLLARLLTEDIAVRTLLSDEDLTIMADATQIDQILFNLTSNAGDAMPQGGTLTIETRLVELDKAFRHIHGYGEPGAYGLVSFSDTGIGMDQATAKRIFDPFFTTKEAGRGTGLGLSTVYGIVKKHNGFINVYSEPSMGTSFHIYFPIAARLAVEAKEAPLSIARGTETILIAEDNEEVRNFMKMLLTEYGYKVTEAVDGADAIARFSERENIDLVILDSVMPKKNGREVYNEIKRMRPEARIIFTSGYTRDIVLDKGVEDEKFDFIPKPISPYSFLEKIRRVLDR
jgi:two-component system, cell cycle sensor histidine kinase and response regulator CckA